jgi:hypothetical protein
MRAHSFALFAIGCSSILGFQEPTGQRPDAAGGTIDGPLGTDAPTGLADGAAGPDADPFSCRGQPLPSTAPAVVSFAGTIYTQNFAAPIAGVQLNAYKVGSSSPIISTTTDSTGHFSVSLSTGSAPIDAYLIAQLANYQDLYVVPPVPLYKDYVGLGLIMYQAAELSAYTDSTNTNLGYDSTQVMVAAVAVDCDGKTLDGATLSTSPAGQVHYLYGTSFPVSATSTNASGIALIFNVPPGTITVNGTASTGDTQRAHSFMAPAGAIVETQIQP